jgi:hypothetical protein
LAYTLQATSLSPATPPGSGFYADLILGDPPGSHTVAQASSASRFVQAMAGFGGGGADLTEPAAASHPFATPLLATTRHAA